MKKILAGLSVVVIVVLLAQHRNRAVQAESIWDEKCAVVMARSTKTEIEKIQIQGDWLMLRYHASSGAKRTDYVKARDVQEIMCQGEIEIPGLLYGGERVWLYNALRTED